MRFNVTANGEPVDTWEHTDDHKAEITYWREENMAHISVQIRDGLPITHSVDVVVACVDGEPRVTVDSSGPVVDTAESLRVAMEFLVKFYNGELTSTSDRNEVANFITDWEEREAEGE